MTKKQFINEYLTGKQPIEHETWELPTKEELDAAEKEFDRLVAKKAPKRRPLFVILRWTAAAAAVVIAIILSQHLWNETRVYEPNLPMTQEMTSRSEPDTIAPPPTPQPVPQQATASKPSRHSKKRPQLAQAKAHASASNSESMPKDSTPPLLATVSDSIEYYLERLEREFAAIDDSINAADLGLLIKADVRLQRIMNGLTGRMVESAINVYHTTDSVSTEPIF